MLMRMVCTNHTMYTMYGWYGMVCWWEWYVDVPGPEPQQGLLPAQHLLALLQPSMTPSSSCSSSSRLVMIQMIMINNQIFLQLTQLQAWLNCWLQILQLILKENTMHGWSRTVRWWRMRSWGMLTSSITFKWQCCLQRCSSCLFGGNTNISKKTTLTVSSVVATAVESPNWVVSFTNSWIINSFLTNLTDF